MLLFLLLSFITNYTYICGGNSVYGAKLLKDKTNCSLVFFIIIFVVIIEIKHEKKFPTVALDKEFLIYFNMMRGLEWNGDWVIVFRYFSIIDTRGHLKIHLG